MDESWIDQVRAGKSVEKVRWRQQLVFILIRRNTQINRIPTELPKYGTHRNTTDLTRTLITTHTIPTG